MRNRERKFVLAQRHTYRHHRSGWAYAMSALEDLISKDGTGVLLDTGVELSFGNPLGKSAAEMNLPYRQPWVGVVHVPHDVPAWHEPERSLRHIRALQVWKASFAYCVGLITLCSWMRRWLEAEFDCPVVDLKHPTETSVVRFEWQRFLDNPVRRVIHVGWWLRRIGSIEKLPATRLRRTLLLPYCSPHGERRFRQALERERAQFDDPPLAAWSAEILPYQPAASYDDLLSRNVVFVDLLTGGANNTLIECMVRNTPVIVNPVPSAVEYLGRDYPLYYKSLEEAAAKLDDTRLIEEAHNYLARRSKKTLSGEHFCRSLADSELFRSLRS